jgi:CHAD domain-containing protein
MVASYTGAMAAPDLPLPTGRAHSAGHAVLHAVRTEVAALAELDPAVRADAPDAVHRMRVTARRLRAVLRVFHRVLDPAVTRPLEGELRWLAGELGAARDAEVVGPLLAADCARLLPDEVVGPVADRLRAATTARHDAARGRIPLCLDSIRYAALRQGLDALVTDPPWGRRATSRADRELTRSLRRCLGDVLGAFAAVDSADPDARDAALHDVRKAVKRLRYATEVALPELPGPARALLSALTPVQRLLGDRQDTVVARTVLRELAASAGERGESEFTYGVLHARQAAAAARLDEALPTAHRTLVHAGSSWPGTAR